MLEEQNARWLNHVGEKMLSSNPKCSPLLVYVGSLEKFPFRCLWPKGRISAHCRTGHRPGGGFRRWAHFRQEELHPLGFARYGREVKHPGVSIILYLSKRTPLV